MVPIYEPGLEDIIQNCLAEGSLKFTTDAAMAVEHGDMIFIAVGTPPEEDGSADLQYVLAVANTIGEHMEGSKVVVNKSTVPVGTADKVTATHCSRRWQSVEPSHEFHAASNPEFLKEGAAIADFTRPDRISCGYRQQPC